MSELVTNRNRAPGPGIYRAGGYRVDLSTREVSNGERRINLSWRSLEAFRILIEAKGEVVGREDFFTRLWPGVAVGESSLNQCIAKLRRDLGEPPEGGLIETVARRGYRLTQAPEPILPGKRPMGVAELPRTAQAQPVGAEAAGPRKGQVAWRRFRWLLGFAALAGVAVSLTWPQWSRRAQARTLTEEGFRYVRENRTAGSRAADALFLRALDLDPTLAPAYAGLAEAMARAVDASQDQAWAMAERAVRLDPRCAQCQAIAGWILMVRRWRLREAAQYLDRAVALSPRDPRILLWHAQMLACSGRLEPALAEIDRAWRLDFKDPAVATMRAGILYLSGRYEEAITAAREALGLQPDFSSAFEWIYRSCLQLSRPEEAMAARAAADAAFVGLAPESQFEMESRWIGAYRRGGAPELVRVLLAESSAEPALDQHRYERATWRMWVGDRQGALDELEHAFDFRPFNCIYLGVDPLFAPLRADARFSALLARIGLAAAIPRNGEK